MNNIDKPDIDFSKLAEYKKVDFKSKNIDLVNSGNLITHCDEQKNNCSDDQELLPPIKRNKNIKGPIKAFNKKHCSNMRRQIIDPNDFYEWP